VTPLLQKEIPSFIKKGFRLIPGLMWLYRFLIFLSLDIRFAAFKAKSVLTDLGKQVSS